MAADFRFAADGVPPCCRAGLIGIDDDTDSGSWLGVGDQEVQLGKRLRNAVADEE